MALRRSGIPNKLVAVSKSTYNGAQCYPFSSNIAKHHSVSKYSGINWKMDSFLQHLDYADDNCLLSHNVLDAANTLYSIEMRLLLLDITSTLEKLGS